ncbi:MAG TPA: glycoside hydrolase family 25 protein [Candidatus Eubacterium faecavium]|nr:glycoside hydrolase family 25 protein [Candidatus Eubacterium faecavium]
MKRIFTVRSLKIKNSTKTKAMFSGAVLIIIAVLIAVIVFANGEVSDKPVLFETNAEYVEGIDVSSHNGQINWKSVANSTDFAIIRAGYRGYGTGKIVADPAFEENMDAANKAGIPAGVYFYSQAISPDEAREEAEFVLDLIRGYDVDLPVFIDFEYAHGSSGELTGRLYEQELSSSEASQIINAFCGTVTHSGKYAGVYSSSSMLNMHVDTSKLDNNLYIWVADYNEAVTYLGAYDIWQYTKNGTCEGVNSRSVDLNYWFINN